MDAASPFGGRSCASSALPDTPRKTAPPMAQVADRCAGRCPPCRRCASRRAGRGVGRASRSPPRAARALCRHGATCRRGNHGPLGKRTGSEARDCNADAHRCGRVQRGKREGVPARCMGLAPASARGAAISQFSQLAHQIRSIPEVQQNTRSRNARWSAPTSRVADRCASGANRIGLIATIPKARTWATRRRKWSSGAWSVPTCFARRREIAWRRSGAR